MDNVSASPEPQVSECSFADLLATRPLSSEDKAQSRPYRYWTEEDNNLLKSMYQQGATLEEIGEFFDRKPNTIGERIKRLGLKRCKALTINQEQFLKKNYWLLGAEGCAKRLKRSRSAITYYAKLLKLKIPARDQYNPPIYRKLLPYDMAKRISILERKSPTSKDKIEDSVVILYDRYRQSKPMAAFHLDELCLALDRHFGRRDGVTASALTHGYKAK
ncbi:hypothetical protein MACH09_14500 [Vibrio sp. MACH09]|uniref:gcrA cell cycle regulator family protein n=1 Tax=Vibrio sp. MACH09 TaxID=3025122 RepID=UPI0027921F17|nr:gcrA cell cycle regulator family protein [Vibrio sp. MACH09]GLO60942.1 hypothetical protein MACH09_14500 [Vibrio sp. MACH09]